MKRRTRLGLSLIALVASAVACDRKPEITVAPPPATKPANAKAPSATRPAARPVSLINISDQIFTFPPAKLVLQQSAAGVTATLFSDDPPEAVKDDYRGNSFRFEMSFDNASLDEMSGQQYVWKTSSDEKRDSLNGIYLNGQRQSVQPTAATMTLIKTGEQWTATLGGEFQYLDNKAADPVPVTIHVAAEMAADLVSIASKS